MTTTKLLTVAVLLSLQAAHGQQAATPAQAQSAPCTPAQQPKPKFKFTIPPKLQQAIDKQRQQLTGKAGVTTPSPEELKKQIEQPKPCLAAPTPTTTKPQQ